MPEIAVDLIDVRKTFGPTVALNRVSLCAYEGEVHAIIGGNGSGKSTLAKVIAGVFKRDFLHGGEIFLDGRPVRYRVPQPAVQDGIMYVTEDRKTEGFFETMSISENIYAGKLASSVPTPKIIGYKDLVKVAEYWRKALNIRAISGDTSVVELSGGNQQKVVIAKTLVQKPRVIIFDEPTRGVDVGAIAEIHQIINQLADDGLVVLVISSNLPEVLSLSDRILVTRQGRVVEEFRPEDATEEKIMYAAVH